MRFYGLRTLVVFGLLLPVVWQAFGTVAPVTAVTDFSKRTPWFSELMPTGRVQRDNSSFILLAEPVYFDLRLPPRVERVTLNLDFTQVTLDVRLGVRQGEGWSYTFPPQVTEGNSRFISVTSFPYVPDHRLRFLISHPDVSAGSVRLSRAVVTIERYSFDWQWLFRTILNRYKLWVESLLAPLARAVLPR